MIFQVVNINSKYLNMSAFIEAAIIIASLNLVHIRYRTGKALKNSFENFHRIIGIRPSIHKMLKIVLEYQILA